MIYTAEDWEFMERSEDSSCNASVEAAQTLLNQHQFRPAIVKVRDSINSLLVKTFSQVNLQSKTSLDSQKFTGQDGYDYQAILESLKKKPSVYPASQVNMSTACEKIVPCSSRTVRTLYDIFNGYIELPCHGRHPEDRFAFSKDYTVALGLAGIKKNPGNQTHQSFETVIAKDGQYRWTRIQFQVPTSGKIRNDTSTENAPDTGLEPLYDFCNIATGNKPTLATPIRLDGTSSPYQWFYDYPFIVHDFPVNQAPMTVSRALQEKLLSARSKIHLAFAIAKSFWQFYDSEWMHFSWALDDAILLLPQKDTPGDLNAEAVVPYLSIRPFLNAGERFSEQEIFCRKTKERRMHQHPFILNLCLALVLLGTKTGSLDGKPLDFDAIHGFCIRQVHHNSSEWPVLPESFKDEYRTIVAVCLPTIACREIRSSAEERRQLLEDDIVRPLYGILTRLRSFEAEEAPARSVAIKERFVMERRNLDLIEDNLSKSSQAWLYNLANSKLTLSLRSAFGNYARPKIALIDTGYDPKSFQENSRARRLGTDHWKDFLNGSPCPLDEDGHGTSMLDILMKVAPFADICIARIAQSNQDLAGPDIRTSQQRLAQAIRWATEVHQAEIISLSLGWEHEQTTEKRWVANAISRALDVRDQKLLFFASASNYGGGTRELFPARHPGVFSIRATDHSGTHQSFNPSLPEGVSTTVYGTLGVGVPTLRRNGIQTPVVRTGTSPATAIAAGIAALIIAYINTSDHGASWDDVKTQAGYERLLQKLSTEPEARKQFITLEEIYHAPAALGRILTKVT